NESARDQRSVGILEVPLCEGVFMTAVDIAKTQFSTERDVTAEYVGGAFGRKPALKKSVGQTFDRIGELVRRKGPHVAEKVFFNVAPIGVVGYGRISDTTVDLPLEFPLVAGEEPRVRAMLFQQI